MEKNRAIPEGYMRIGELAKKTGVTVRALQYYDGEGLLTPSTESEGGFRLYTDKDMARLLQILAMKQLGFPLGEIKKRLASMDTPSDVVKVLEAHEAELRRKRDLLSESLDAIGALKTEIAQTETVDFKKYAAILMNVQIKNEYYWVVKHIDDDTLNLLAERLSREQAVALSEGMNRSFHEAAGLVKEGVLPGSRKGQRFAKECWETMMELTGGDMDVLMKMNEQVEKIGGADEKWDERFAKTRHFMQEAMEIYFNQGEGPKGGGIDER